MSVTVTIHNGEMGQIKHFIDEKKKKGQLYGLWTHSNQPVIQYVTGGVKEHDKEKIRSYLLNNHGLKQVGNWSTGKFDDGQVDSHCLSFVSMTVNSSPSNKKAINVERMVVSQNNKELNGEIEILNGDSAFRLLRNGPFQGDSYLTYFHHGKVDPIDVESLRSATTTTEVTVRGEQWYSTEEGMKLFGKIFGALKQQFAISGTSRSTETHDISISIKIQNHDFSVDFQSDFPEGKAFLTSLKRSGDSCEIELYEDRRDKTKTKATKCPKQNKAGLDGESKKQKGLKKQSGKVTPVEDKKEEAESVAKNEGKKEGGDGDEDEEEDKNEEQEGEEDEENSPPSGYEVDQMPLDDDKIAQLLVQGILRLTSGGSNPGGTGGSCSRKKGGSNSGGRGGSRSGGTGGFHCGDRVNTENGSCKQDTRL